MVLVVKNPSVNAGDIRDSGSIPGSGRPLEEEMAMHSSILARRNPWTEEPGGPQSIGSHRVIQDRSNLVCMHAHTAVRFFLELKVSQKIWPQAGCMVVVFQLLGRV